MDALGEDQREKVRVAAEIRSPLALTMGCDRLDFICTQRTDILLGLARTTCRFYFIPRLELFVGCNGRNYPWVRDFFLGVTLLSFLALGAAQAGAGASGLCESVDARVSSHCSGFMLPHAFPEVFVFFRTLATGVIVEL